MKEFAYDMTAMGTDVSVSFVCTNEQDAYDAKTYAFATIQAYEERFSRFIPESELSQLNTLKRKIVSPEFYEVLTESTKLSTQTNFAFNPLLQIALYGYTTSYTHQKPSPVSAPGHPYNKDITTLHIDNQTREVTLQDNQKLDFGGILKGMLSEKIAKTIQNKYPHFQGVIINIGGDLHTRGYDAQGNTFSFAVYNPITQTEYEVPIHNQSLATSGAYKRTWETDNGTYHHILDQTGTKNANTSIISASIIGSSGAVCEAYTKVLINMPTDHALPLIEAQKLKYLAVDTKGTLYTNISNLTTL